MKNSLEVLVLSFAVLSACAEKRETVCATYACVNTVRMDGSVPAGDAVTSVDATFCAGDVCREQRVAVATGSVEACEIDWTSKVCLERKGDQLAVAVVWHHGMDEPAPSGVDYRVKLVDPATGVILLDRTRSVEASITLEDDCHRCWNAEIAL